MNSKTNRAILQKTIKTALLAFEILFSTNVFAQHLYEIKYKFYEKDPNTGREALGQEYRSLIFYFDEDNESNVMRTRYSDPVNGWTVVEQKIRTSQTSIDGKYYWTLGGVNVKFITSVAADTKYNPDKIVLSKTPGETYYRPDYVYDDGNNRGIITSFKVLNNFEVSNDFLAPFYWHWPETRQNNNTVTNNNNNNNNNTTVGGTTLHLILVTNSNDASLGSGFFANHKKIKSLFNDAAMASGMKVNIREITGDGYTKQNVVSAINSISPSANDVVVFYYSGHGFRFKDQKSQWPQMDLRQGTYQDMAANSLNIDNDVYKVLSKKNPRLLMVIGECCNVDLGVGTPSKTDPVTMAPSGNLLNNTVVKNLFSAKGKVLLATSKPYQASWYYITYGGYFCNSFISSFLNDVGVTSGKTQVSWKDIFSSAISATKKRAETDEDPSLQNPIYHFELK